MSDATTVRLRDGALLWAAVSGPRSGPPVVLLHGGPGLWDYLEPVAALLEDTFTVIRFDQRGCGRSSAYGGPFTIEQAIDDADQVRVAFGFDRWAVAGHSWGADLALRYATRCQDRTSAVAYVAGVGVGNGFHDGYDAERDRRLGPASLIRLNQLSAIAAADRTQAQERERCLLNWRVDYAPGPDAVRHARALWETRPPGAAINQAANRQLWGERKSDDILARAARLNRPVTLILGELDPRPWKATDSLFAALPNAARTVVAGAGHAPWTERPAETRRLLLDALHAAESPAGGDIPV